MLRATLSHPRLGRLGTSGEGGRTRRPALVLYWLLGALLLLGPASMAPDLGWDTRLVKLTRIAVLGAVVVGSLPWFRIGGAHTASYRMLLFAGVFTASALWSVDPVMGLAYKGLFFASCVVGVALGNAISTRQATISFLRVMTTVSLISLVVIAIGAGNGSAVMESGRLVAFGINPNLLGQSLALFAILGLVHAFLDGTGLRVLGAIVGVAAAYVVIMSGSRGAAAIVVISLAGMFLFKVIHGSRESATVLVWVAVIGVGLMVASLSGSKASDSPAASRTPLLLESFSELTTDNEQIRIVAELTKDTRGSVWRAARRHIKAKPLFGWGWKTTTSGGWSTYQSAYLQVLVESGILGAIFVVSFLLAAIRLIIRGLSPDRSAGRFAVLGALYASLAASLLVHGAFESAMVVGTTPNAVILGFALVNLEKMTGSGKRTQRVRRGIRFRIGARRQGAIAAVPVARNSGDGPPL